MEKILITGSEGFIGSHLTELLVQKGYKVKAFVKYNFQNNWGWLETSKYKKDIEILSGVNQPHISPLSNNKNKVLFHLVWAEKS